MSDFRNVEILNFKISHPVYTLWGLPRFLLLVIV